MSKILLLGGTEEARHLADALAAADVPFLVSLAGRVSGPRQDHVRVGGFGGVAGLRQTIEADGYGIVLDATHPFAAKISPNARAAAEAAGAAYYRLERKPWRRGPLDRWVEVASVQEAATRLMTGTTAFLSVGAGGIAPFLPRRDVRLVIRSIEPPEIGDRENVVIILRRGPFEVEDERELWSTYRFDVLITKNAGGHATAAKLAVARERMTRVIMVRRPLGQPPPAAHTVEEMMTLVLRHF